MSTKQDILEELRRIEDTTGCLTPDQVVEAAKDPDSPMHDRFEWDVSKAAARDWIRTARQLIVSHGMTIRYHNITIRAPIYMRDPSKEAHEQGYRSVMRLRSEPEAAHDALSAEMVRVAAIFRRARHLAIVFGMADRIDEMEAMVSAFIGDLAESKATDVKQPAA